MSYTYFPPSLVSLMHSLLYVPSHSQTLIFTLMLDYSVPDANSLSNSVLTVPRLEFFSAESLGDGRSSLLQWRLLSSGGYDVDIFTIEVTPSAHA